MSPVSFCTAGHRAQDQQVCLLGLMLTLEFGILKFDASWVGNWTQRSWVSWRSRPGCETGSAFTCCGPAGGRASLSLSLPDCEML